jgi:serine/threonine-protein kinase
MCGKSAGKREVPTRPEAERIDRICDSFEDGWRNGDAPRIEDYLEAMEAPANAVLLRELLELEIELRSEAGQRPTAEEYRDRFPDLAAVVEDVFCEERAPDEIPSTITLLQLRADVPPGEAETVDASTLEWDPQRVDDRAEAAGPLVRIVGDYVIGERLGSGGMGVVYRAYHRPTRRYVALKLIKAEWWGGSTEATQSAIEVRFRNEAQALAQLEHDHIVPLYDVGHAHGLVYFAMKYIDGRDLSQVVQSEGPLDGRKAAYYVEAIARAIQYAHDNKVLHRDVKPRNVMVDRNDRPILIDLGLAKALEATDYQTITGRPLGTPEYMSPEQARGSGVGFGSDVYSLGATLYTLLIGRPPFTGNDPVVILRKVIDEEPVWPREADRRVARDLKAICLKCLEKDPKRRIKSAGALAVALKNYLADQPTGVTLDGPWASLKKWCKRQPWRAAAAAITLVCALVLLLGWAWTERRNRAMAEVFLRDLQTTPLGDVPRKIEEMAAYRGWVNPRLHELLSGGFGSPTLRTRLLLALLPSEPGWANDLVERLLAPDCEPEEHGVIREALRALWPGTAKTAREVLDNPRSDAGRRTRAAAALIALDSSKAPASNRISNPVESAWAGLRWTKVPDARTDLLDWLVLSKVDPAVLAERLERESEPSARRMLIQCLGALGDGAPPDGLSPTLLSKFSAAYREDPDAGIHSSLAYLLRRWGQGEEMKRLDAELAGKPRESRGWYVNGQKMTLVVLGGPEDEWLPTRSQQPSYRFAIAATETALALYQEFDPQHASRRTDNKMLPQTNPDAPADLISYYDAARFCNWLSRKEGIPEDQWCYVPGTAEGEWNLAPGYLARQGYRLPSVSEWEYAARAGTTTERFFGQSVVVRRDHAWHEENTRHQPRTVGLLQPNDFGLFDMIGNVMEWCYNPNPRHPRGCDCQAKNGAECRKMRRQTMKGGGFDNAPGRQSVLEKDLASDSANPSQRWVFAGFRVVRRVP